MKFIELNLKNGYHIRINTAQITAFGPMLDKEGSWVDVVVTGEVQVEEGYKELEALLCE